MTNVNFIIEFIKQKVAKIKETATERSYYPLLCSFFEEYAKSALKLRNPSATPEETSKQYDKHVGFPDITVRDGNTLIGWIEVKSPKENLTSEKFDYQFTKYKDSLENIIFTNLREWQLWQWMKEEGENSIDAKKTAELIFDLTSIDGANSSEFELFLTKFFEGRPYQARTPKQLALALAKKTRLLSKQVEEALETHDEDSDLKKLKETFEKTLIQDISEHQFANMVAETMAYSLFLAALEHSRRDKDSELTLTNAIDYLPINVPILADLYSLIKKVAGVIPNIYEATRLLVDQLNASEIERIHQKLVEHKPGEDPVIQFYEPFLKEYDPKEREARGVYYTPKPVVDYIVKSVDWILRNKFDKKKGLADESVHLLDPATGTGTFLMSAIQEIYGNIRKENKTLGEEMVRKEFNRVVLNHILKHFYGFELLIAPYAIAHLKLTLEVERLGFEFALTKEDGDKDNDRFKVYLANTLDDPEKPPLSLFGFDSIPQESESARKVKKDAPILAIIGNPPYSGISLNPVEKIIIEKGKKKKVKTWIGNLIEDYKYTEGDRKTGKHFNEKKHWLGDDYVKFIRFGQWKVDQHGVGVLALITNHSYLDNLTFCGMRWQLMNSFDEIYILNLHGNAKTEKTTPKGDKDENVFLIQQGVAISIFIKKSRQKKDKKRKVYYSDIWGPRQEKYNILLDYNCSTMQWTEINPSAPDYFLIPKSNKNLNEYQEYWSIADIFPINVTGIVTARDEFVIDYQKEDLLKRIDDFCNPSNKDDDIRSKYFGTKKSRKYLPGDTRGWKMVEARKKIAKERHSENIKNILYRPFDIRSIYYHPKMIDWGRETIMQSFLLRDNLGLVSCRQSISDEWRHTFLTKLIVDDSMVSNKTKERGYCFPLYLHRNKNKEKELFQSKEDEEQPNLSPDFLRAFSEKIGLSFVFGGRGDLKKTFGPEDVFYYAYAVFHSPTYRIRYTEQLKIDFPRLPLTSDKGLFKKLVEIGNALVNLHLLGENPFDNSKTIFDDSNNWGVKIGGEKPKNLEDWKVSDIRYDEKAKRVYVNSGQYFEGIEKEVWEFMIGGYQVCEKWLKDRKKAECSLSTDDLRHYMKIIVSLRETIRLMKEIEEMINSYGGFPKAFI